MDPDLQIERAALRIVDLKVLITLFLLFLRTEHRRTGGARTKKQGRAHESCRRTQRETQRQTQQVR